LQRPPDRFGTRPAEPRLLVPAPPTHADHPAPGRAATVRQSLHRQPRDLPRAHGGAFGVPLQRLLAGRPPLAALAARRRAERPTAHLELALPGLRPRERLSPPARRGASLAVVLHAAG